MCGQHLGLIRVLGLGCRFRVLGFRVFGLGFRVCGLYVLLVLGGFYRLGSGMLYREIGWFGPPHFAGFRV